MADSWDMSFLVDQTTQIQEARGNLARHFGMLQQVLIGKHLVNFIGADDRLAFLRMMGRLSQRSWQDTVACRLRTPLSGEKRVALQARPGTGPTAWWLMISDSGAEALPLISEVEIGDAMASEQEFGAVAAAAAGDTPGKLDLSVFRAAALADGAPGARLTESKHAELHQKIGETLRETATGGIVTQPARGEYALVHDKDVPAHHIAERITVTADAVGVPPHELGLAHDSEPVPNETGAEEVRELIHNLRLDLAGRATGLKRSGGGYGTRQPKGQGAGHAGADTERKPSLLASLLGLIGK
ncbi:MAG TPA: PAS domain-containing protein [Dongiaceae bacterium]|nr:PAS domain-containing protein [Dongiaceae bacterium]